MNVRNLKTIELVNLICETEEQELINMIAYELTCRFYVPNEETTFEEMLYSLGYKIKNKNNKLIK